MYQYAAAAGLSWPCVGNGDCAGGLGQGCNKAAVLAYLADPAGDTKIPQVCKAGLCAPNFNSGPGLIYDVLCDGDFIPPGAGKGYADTQLALGNYKLLWVPHWDTNGTVPTGATDTTITPALPATTAGDKLAWQLRTISSFVQAGNNLFGECLAIQAMEGVQGQDSANGNPVGIPVTRFQTPTGMQKWNGTGPALQILDVAHPSMQVGDFAFSVVTGAITTYFPRAGVAAADAYRSNVERLITESQAAPIWDVSSTVQVQGNDSVARGSVAYLGGHDYSPTADVDSNLVPAKVPSAHVHAGQTAGTRIVLNTLFNLGFGCADPNTACTTSGLGACSAGVLKCASGGGYQCVGASPASRDLCQGKDDNCNGVIDDDCNPPACSPGDSRTCYDGPTGTQDVGACRHGAQTCTGGLWGPCQGQVLPTPEVCNGVDDDCSGNPDDGDLCATGYACTNGSCLPAACNSENARCPVGFDCNSVTQACTAAPCGSGPACGVGKVCQSGTCLIPARVWSAARAPPAPEASAWRAAAAPTGAPRRERSASTGAASRTRARAPAARTAPSAAPETACAPAPAWSAPAASRAASTASASRLARPPAARGSSASSAPARWTPARA